ncbi:MAG: sigma-70 family RNA polymerase sigma factor [Proteobacteria bacterium]|nr:sigma-70 family RNA polymerase sigma factor [Pseudomonadota bacterium]
MVGDVISTIERCLAGDGDAWKGFVKDFAPLGKNILLRSFDFKPVEQDDILQNVFVKLVNGGFKHFRGTSEYEFLKYFKTIVINEARSHITSENKTKGTIQLNGEMNLDGRTDGQDGLLLMDTIQDPDKNSRPDYAIEDRDLLEKAAGIMKTYPLLDQEIFLMKVKGYKDEDIKTILKIPTGTVASKYSRIRARIAEELGEE